MSLLQNLGLASKDQDAKLEKALLEAAERVIKRIHLPGLSEKQKHEMQAVIRQAVKDDNDQQVREILKLTT